MLPIESSVERANIATESPLPGTHVRNASSSSTAKARMTQEHSAADCKPRHRHRQACFAFSTRRCTASEIEVATSSDQPGRTCTSLRIISVSQDKTLTILRGTQYFCSCSRASFVSISNDVILRPIDQKKIHEERWSNGKERFCLKRMMKKTFNLVECGVGARQTLTESSKRLMYAGQNHTCLRHEKFNPSSKSKQRCPIHRKNQ